MKQAWMTKEFIEAIENAIDKLDVAQSYLQDAIWEAEDVDDDTEDEDGYTASDYVDEMKWDIDDEIGELIGKLQDIIEGQE